MWLFSDKKGILYVRKIKVKDNKFIMELDKITPEKIYFISLILGLIAGSSAAILTVEQPEQERNFCKDLGQDLQQNQSEAVKQINCHEPGVISIEELDEEVGANLDCVCSVRDNQDGITIQPIYGAS